ncbi:MAG: hypothetical protein R3321_14765 [Nitrososphaeraceae archaeon]|nr:hypothetical protein [Nitrososphaeraceae archaeon]
MKCDSASQVLNTNSDGCGEVRITIKTGTEAHVIMVNIINHRAVIF